MSKQQIVQRLELVAINLGDTAAIARKHQCKKPLIASQGFLIPKPSSSEKSKPISWASKSPIQNRFSLLFRAERIVMDNIEKTGVVLKAHNGDRAANLESIADSVNTMTNWVEGDDPRKHNYPSGINLTAQEVHRLNGWMEQLRIIADEWRTMATRPQRVR